MAELKTRDVEKLRAATKTGPEYMMVRASGEILEPYQRSVRTRAEVFPSFLILLPTGMTVGVPALLTQAALDHYGDDLVAIMSWCVFEEPSEMVKALRADLHDPT